MKLVKCKSKKDCWKSENVLPKVKKKMKAVFFQEFFFSKNRFWRRKTQIGEDCLNVYVQSVKFFCRMCKKNKKMTSLYFFSKKNLCPQTNFWTGKMMLMPFLPKAFVQNLTCSNCTKSGWKHTEKTLTRF